MSPLAILLIILVLLITFGIFAYLLLSGGNSEKEQARMIVTGQKSSAKQKDKINPQDKRRAEIARKLKQGGEDEEASKGKTKKQSLRYLILQTGFDITIKQYLLYSAAVSLALSFGALILGLSPILMLLMAIIGFFGIPRFALNWMAKRRQKKFMDDFADSLEAMVRLLKAGMPVSEAVAMISREYTGPVGEEMAKMYDAQRIGVPLQEAAYEAARRMPLPEVKMFATGISIQAQTGSALSEILLSLASLIRARYKLARKVKSLSSEAKSSAAIIGALPVVVGGGIYLLKPEHIMVLLDDPFGKVLFGGAVIWMMLGVLSMKIMINFKV